MERSDPQEHGSGTRTGTQPTVAIVLVGDEILSGRTRDENGVFLTRELARVGARVSRIVVIPDDVDAIAAEVKTLAAGHDFVITTGGVGPTHDDMTPLAVGRAFDTPLAIQPELEKTLRQSYGSRANDAVLRMAMLPAGTEVITGPGITFPPFRFRNVVMLPGVPRYVQNKFPLISHLFAGTLNHRSELLVPAEETDIAATLTKIAEENGDLKIGSYPMTVPDERGNRVAITVSGTDRARVEECIGELLASLPGAVRKEEPEGAAHV